jgi:hypothetical protein
MSFLLAGGFQVEDGGLLDTGDDQVDAPAMPACRLDL